MSGTERCVEIDRYVGVVGTPKCTLKMFSLLGRFDQFTAAALVH